MPLAGKWSIVAADEGPVTSPLTSPHHNNTASVRTAGSRLVLEASQAFRSLVAAAGASGGTSQRQVAMLDATASACGWGRSAPRDPVSPSTDLQIQLDKACRQLTAAVATIMAHASSLLKVSTSLASSRLWASCRDYHYHFGRSGNSAAAAARQC